MKLAEFIQMTTEHNRRSVRLCVIWIVGWMIPVFAYLSFMRRLEPYLDERFEPFAAGLLLVTPLFIILAGAAGGGLLMSRKLENGLSVKCPHCQKDLSAPMVTMVVVGSRNCAYCGKPVITEESPS